MSAWIHEHPDCVAEGLSPELFGKYRVLHVEGTTLYASRGLDLFRSTDEGASFQRIGFAPGDWLERTMARTQLTSRVFRTGFHGITPLPTGDLIASVRGSMLRLAKDSLRFEPAHELQRGHRPLNVCVHPSGRSYFGEYFSNPGREEVHVFGSDDGSRWDVVGTFEEKSIRHIHGIVWDPYREGMWVLTGDEGDEAGLWWTDDEFRTIEPVLRGDQRARAVTVLPLESGLVVPMDSPFEVNHIQHFDPRSGDLQSLATVPGSVFFSGRTQGLWLLSTAVETSEVNCDQRPALFASRDGIDWHLATRFRRDWPVLARTGSLLQWPSLILPTGTSSLSTVFASGQGLRGAHGHLLGWSEAELMNGLPIHRERTSA